MGRRREEFLCSYDLHRSCEGLGLLYCPARIPFSFPILIQHPADSSPLGIWLLRDSFATESQCLPPPQTRTSPITLFPLWKAASVPSHIPPHIFPLLHTLGTFSSPSFPRQRMQEKNLHFCSPKSTTFFNFSWCSLGNLSTRKKGQKRFYNVCSCIPNSRLHANKKELHFRSDSSPSFSSSSCTRIHDKRNPRPRPNNCWGGKKPSNVRWENIRGQRL